tara:strand:- start:1265 stop:1957 length:693 start_codon:yes stop_codon:yes gene_type:complete
MTTENNKNFFFERFERKWFFQKKNIDLNSLILSIYRSSLNFRSAYESRQVNSIYFDDVNFSSIYQNLDGVAFKRKYRVRWYGIDKNIENCSLEIKEKQGFVSKKKIIPIKLENKIYFNNEGIEKIKHMVLKLINHKINLFPILSTHYRRNYYVSDNNKIRATLDYDIKSNQIFYKKDLNFKKNFGDFILELKYDKNFDNFVRGKIKDISIRYSKSSKYINSAINTPIYFS